MSDHGVTAGHELSDRDRRLVVALADGTLAGLRRRRAERRLEHIRGGTALVARQQRVADLLAGQAAAAPSVPVAHGRPVLPRLAAVGVCALATTVLAAVLVLVLVEAGPNPPSVAEAATVGFLEAGDPAPRSRPDTRALVDADFEGVPFPNWSRRFGWHTTGARSDELGGRRMRTVFYGHMDHRIGYTVVSGAPLAIPSGGQRVIRNGVEVTLIGSHMHALAVFVRGGHTCILSGHVAHRATLIKLAAWKGDGAVRFARGVE